MKNRSSSLLIALLACSTVFAQMNPHQRLQDALVLEKQGQFEPAILLARQTLDSGQLSPVETGRACIILGLAYEMEGQFPDAQHVFDQALRILEHDLEHSSDYASALDNYGGLYVDEGRIEEAGIVWRKALALQLQEGDHAAATRTLTNLAGLALSQRRLREARDWLKKASAQRKLATDLGDDDRALLFETQGWLALLQKHSSAAVAGYQHALELSRRSRGDQHWLTGYEQLLLGKAYAQAGELQQALAEMHQGMLILEQALGRHNPKYFAAEIAYAQVLDVAGSRSDAAPLKRTAEQASKDFYSRQCVGCTISVTAFR